MRLIQKEVKPRPSDLHWQRWFGLWIPRMLATQHLERFIKCARSTEKCISFYPDILSSFEQSELANGAVGVEECEGCHQAAWKEENKINYQ